MSKETRKRLAVLLLATMLFLAALPIMVALWGKLWSLV